VKADLVAQVNALTLKALADSAFWALTTTPAGNFRWSVNGFSI
jgi:hypothetical protein